MERRVREWNIATILKHLSFASTRFQETMKYTVQETKSLLFALGRMKGMVALKNSRGELIVIYCLRCNFATIDIDNSKAHIDWHKRFKVK